MKKRTPKQKFVAVVAMMMSVGLVTGFSMQAAKIEPAWSAEPGEPGTPICGKEEHTHVEGCGTKIETDELDEYDGDVYDKKFVITGGGDTEFSGYEIADKSNTAITEFYKLTCGKEEHEHVEACYCSTHTLDPVTGKCSTCGADMVDEAKITAFADAVDAYLSKATELGFKDEFMNPSKETEFRTWAAGLGSSDKDALDALDATVIAKQVELGDDEREVAETRCFEKIEKHLSILACLAAPGMATPLDLSDTISIKTVNGSSGTVTGAVLQLWTTTENKAQNVCWDDSVTSVALDSSITNVTREGNVLKIPAPATDGSTTINISEKVAPTTAPGYKRLGDGKFEIKRTGATLSLENPTGTGYSVAGSTVTVTHTANATEKTLNIKLCDSTGALVPEANREGSKIEFWTSESDHVTWTYNMGIKSSDGVAVAVQTSDTITLPENTDIYFKELEPPTGYNTIPESATDKINIASGVITATTQTAYTTGTTTTTNDTLIAKHTAATTKVSITKQDADSKNLSGAKLALYAGTPDAKGKEIMSWSSGSSAKESPVLSTGNYFITETEAPKGYQYCSNVEFKVDASGVVTLTGGNGTLGTVSSNTYPITIKDKEISDLTMKLYTKKDGKNESDTSKAQTGWKYTLYHYKGDGSPGEKEYSDSSKWESVGDFDTTSGTTTSTNNSNSNNSSNTSSNNSSSNSSTKNAYAGKTEAKIEGSKLYADHYYKVVEITSPVGHEFDNDPVVFKLDKSGEIEKIISGQADGKEDSSELQVYNRPLGPLVIHKIAEGGTTELSGANFALYEGNGGTTSSTSGTNSTNSTSSNTSSNNNSSSSSSSGTSSDSSTNSTTSNNSSSSSGTSSSSTSNRTSSSSSRTSNSGSTTQTAPANSLATWTSAETAYTVDTSKLQVGVTYGIRELKAPVGYATPSTDFKFVIGKDNKVTITTNALLTASSTEVKDKNYTVENALTIANKKGGAVKTGDHTFFALWLDLCIVAIGGMYLCGFSIFDIRSFNAWVAARKRKQGNR